MEHISGADLLGMRAHAKEAENYILACGAYIDRLTRVYLAAQVENVRLLSAREVTVAAEREACAEACESVHLRPIQGAHEEYLAGKEMAIQQCARAIRRRCTDAP